MSPNDLLKRATALNERLAVTRQADESMGDSISEYQGYAQDFARKFGHRLFDLRHFGDVITADFRNSGSRMDAQKLAMWLKARGVQFIAAEGKSLTLHWFL